jgi:hypothetical protein
MYRKMHVALLEEEEKLEMAKAKYRKSSSSELIDIIN